MRKKITVLLLVIISIFTIGCGKKVEETKEINISVAASLLEPMKEISSEFEKDNNVKININSGGSGALKKQISNGADVGVFFSADDSYVDELIDEGLALKEDKVIPITNKLVLIKSKNANSDVKDIKDLAKVNVKIAIGEVSTVPAGKYAKETLVNEGIWDDIESNIIYCNNVTAVKSYVENGEVDYGFIYKSDSINLENSKVIIDVPDDLHEKIIYSLVPIKEYKNYDECKKFIEFINSEKSREVLKKFGFNIVE